MSTLSTHNDDFVTSVLPFVNADTRKRLESAAAIFDLFPGQSPTEVAKTVKSLVEKDRTSLPALTRRGQEIVHGHSESGNGQPGSQESIADFLNDAGKLSKSDLTKLGKALDLELSGSKDEMIEWLRRWTESGGRERPPSEEELAKEQAQRLAGDLPERMTHLDTSSADMIIRRAEELARDRSVSKEVFRQFAHLIVGYERNESKPRILQRIKDAVNRLAVVYARTSG